MKPPRRTSAEKIMEAHRAQLPENVRIESTQEQESIRKSTFGEYMIKQLFPSPDKHKVVTSYFTHPISIEKAYKERQVSKTHFIIETIQEVAPKVFPVAMHRRMPPNGKLSTNIDKALEGMPDNLYPAGLTAMEVLYNLAKRDPNQTPEFFRNKSFIFVGARITKPDGTMLVPHIQFREDGSLGGFNLLDVTGNYSLGDNTDIMMRNK